MDASSPHRWPAWLTHAVGIAATVVLIVLFLGTHGSLMVLPAAALLLAFVLFWRRWPVLSLALSLAGAAAITAYSLHSALGWVGVLAVDLAVALLAAARRPAVSIPGALVAGVVELLLSPFFSGSSGDLLRSMEVIGLALVCVWMLGNSVGERSRRAAVMRVRDTEQAVAAERLRIARELHDLVAHSLGVIAIQAGVGSRVIDRQPAEARNALEAIEVTSRQSLAELRRTLIGLRQAEPEGAPAGPAPGLNDLEPLITRAGIAHVQVEVERTGDVRDLPPDLELHAYRIVQEAVTNVVRHAGARFCRVRLDYGPGELSIEVLDDGDGGITNPGNGFGLIGMRERVSLLAGDFAAGPGPEGGFRVAARLPAPVPA